MVRDKENLGLLPYHLLHLHSETQNSQLPTTNLNGTRPPHDLKLINQYLA